ncbi:hypothetical protein AAFF_G00026300 [Aldrovandia affinis]|uniref:Uncharacterized protein n=1 Tax=Aldrovandia affinis TaxID=143900 RepID=A0AAD7WGA8_9TELE|nr:hypothetical protein AAFF_G00026300 [Aldrovandia affinis]
MRTQRLRERQEEYKRERDQQFQYKTLDNITGILIETGEISSSSSSDEEQEGRAQKRQKTSETDTHDQLQQRVRLQQNPRERRNSSLMLLKQTQMIRYHKSFSI